MLSYLKDGNTPPATEAMEHTQEEQTSQQYLTVSDYGKKARQSTIVLALLFAVGGLGVWLMIQKITPASAKAAPNEDQKQLDVALIQLNTMKTEMNNQMNSVAGRFDQFSSVNQIGVDELKKNPFRRELGYDTDNPEEDAGFIQRQQLEQEAQRRLVGLELWSITSTPKGMCCMINDQVLYKNDEINGMKVHSIHESEVTLDFQGIPVQLKMDK